MKSFIRNNGFYFIGIAILIILWETLSLIYANSLAFPKLSTILVSLKNLLISKSFYKALLFTFLRLVLALVISLLLSTILSYVSRNSVIFKQIITPLLSLLKSTPLASIIIIILLMFGHEKASCIISIIIMLPIQYEGFYSSYNAIPDEIKDDIKMISKNNYIIFKEIYFPLALPIIATTLLQSFSLGIRSLVMAEVITTPKYSIGRELKTMQNNLDISGIFAWTIVLFLISFIIEIFLNKMKSKVEIKNK